MELDNGAEPRSTVDKNGEQVAQSMPHGGLCVIVRLRQLLLQDEVRPKLHLKDQTRRRFLQDLKQKNNISAVLGEILSFEDIISVND